MSDDLATFEAIPVPPATEQPASESQSNPAAQQSAVDVTLLPAVTDVESMPIVPEPHAANAVEGAKTKETSLPAPESESVPQPEAHRGDMHEALAEDYAYQRPKRGEIREGHIIAIRADSIVVDMGLKREGIVPADDMERLGPEVLATLKVGDRIPVYVLRPEDDKEGILVSLHRARQEQDWIDAQRLLETAGIWEGTIKGFNRGGLIVHYGKIRGFVPASQVTGISRRMDSTALQNRLSEMVGQNMPLKVIEVDRQNRRLIFSERNARREWRSLQRDKLLDELREGDHVRGLVSNVCDFGVFVDVGGTDGLVHISELSWRRTGHPSELLKVGDEVEAYVLRVDKERKRIGLSLRLMEPDPWEHAEERYQVGQVVTGVVTKITAFGAFAALDDGIEGLIHVSELSETPPRHPEEVLSVGAALPLCVVRVEGSRRRMGLSLRRVSDEDRVKWEQQNKPEVQTHEGEEPGGEAQAVAEEAPAVASLDVTPTETPAEAAVEPSGEARPQQVVGEEEPSPASPDVTPAETAAEAAVEPSGEAGPQEVVGEEEPSPASPDVTPAETAAEVAVEPSAEAGPQQVVGEEEPSPACPDVTPAETPAEAAVEPSSEAEAGFQQAASEEAPLPASPDVAPAETSDQSL